MKNLLNKYRLLKNNRKIFYNWDIHKDRPAFQKLVKGKNVAVIGGGIDAMKKAGLFPSVVANGMKLKSKCPA